MKMTKTLALAAVVAGALLAGSTLRAQDASTDKHPGSPGMRGRPNVEQIAKELKLTDDQKTKLEAAIKDQQTKMKALREDTSLSKEDRHAKMKEIHEGFMTSVKAILTPEQLEKWQKHMQRRPQGGKPDQSGDKPSE